MLRHRRLYLLGCLGLLLAGFTWACSVPVFRYALERWRHDAQDEQFRLTIFHAGPLPDEVTAALTEIDSSEGPRPNWVVDTIDTTGPLDKDQQNLWAMQKDAVLPWMVLRAPETNERKPALMSGHWDYTRLRRWTDSPLRQKLAGMLLSGASVVWVFVESGDRERDDLVAGRILGELKRLEETTQLPVPDDDKESTLLSPVPLKISFPLVRVSRQAADEQDFFRQLIVLDEDFTDATGPLLFSIFGRGRLLTGLREKEMTPRLLEDVVRFLCGACSCRVKAQNPGVDLLWCADWDSFLNENERRQAENPILTRIPEPIPLTAKGTTAGITAELTSAEPSWGRPVFLTGLGITAALVLLCGWWVLRSGRPL